MSAAEVGHRAGADVEVKTRLPVHLHVALANLARRNERSMAAELRLAIAWHVARSYVEQEGRS